MKTWLFLLSSLCVIQAVPESDIFPMVEYWRAGDYRPNPLCEGYQGAPKPKIKAKAYPFRQSVGLTELTTKIVRSGEQSGSSNDRARRSSTNNKDSSWDSILAFSARKTSSNRPFGAVLCDVITQGLGPKAFCNAMGNFSKAAQCLTEYQYSDPSSVIQELAPQRNFGFSPIPPECLESTQGDPINLLLRQHPTTPAYIPKATAQAEGPVYYLAHRAIDLVTRYAEFEYLRAVLELGDKDGSNRAANSELQRMQRGGNIGIHDIFQDQTVFTNLLPGFEVVRVFYSNEPRFKGGPTLRLPYAVMASKGPDLLIALRQPITTFDARLAMYNQLALRYLYNFTGEIHDGGANIYQTLSGSMEFMVEQFYDTLTQSRKWPKHAQITLTAAGVPANAVALVMGTHLATALRAHLGHSQVVVNVVTFGNPYSADKKFIETASKSVETRHIMIPEDSSDLFPCSSTFSCDETDLEPRTGLETGISYNYEPTPGIVWLNSAPLKPWQRQSRYPLSMQLGAIRDCGYPCILASDFCPSDASGMDFCNPKYCQALVPG